ncbi:hypothetical protein NBRC116494_05860 [Aurantivibrio plasticivorans]
MNNNVPFLRDRDNRVIAGVCSGLGKYFDVEPLFVRIAFVVGTIFWPLTIVAYIILVFTMSKKPTDLRSMGEDISSSRVGKRVKSIDYKRGLHKNRRDKKISGVCSGIAEYIGTSPFVVRLVFVLATFIFLGPFALVIYIIAAILMEDDPDYLAYRKQCTRGDTSYREWHRRQCQQNHRDQHYAQPFNKRDLQRTTERFATLEKQLQRLEATITSKKFKLHNEFNRM